MQPRANKLDTEEGPEINEVSEEKAVEGSSLYLSALLRIDRDKAESDDLKLVITELFRRDAHLGHRKSRKNPLMDSYIYGNLREVQFIDLNKTAFLLARAVSDIARNFADRECRMLFVGTKDQASQAIQAYAQACDQSYVNNKWMGGTLTNFHGLQSRIRTMESLRRLLADEDARLSKIDKLKASRKLEKLERSFAGMRNMFDRPDFVFIVDTNKEKVAVAEAKRLGIPIIALVDTNSNPLGIQYPIPCNDDSKAVVEFACELMADAILQGIEDHSRRRPQGARTGGPRQFRQTRGMRHGGRMPGRSFDNRRPGDSREGDDQAQERNEQGPPPRGRDEGQGQGGGEPNNSRGFQRRVPNRSGSPRAG